jgi:hypothetical protein
MRYEPPLVREEAFGNVTLQLIGGEVPVFSTPRAMLKTLEEYETLEVVLLLNSAHRVTPSDLGIEGFPQWDEYAQYPSGGFIDWPTIEKLREALRALPNP